MNLIATGRSSTVSWARYTRPIAPLPTHDLSRYPSNSVGGSHSNGPPPGPGVPLKMGVAWGVRSTRGFRGGFGEGARNWARIMPRNYTRTTAALAVAWTETGEQGTHVVVASASRPVAGFCPRSGHFPRIRRIVPFTR